MSEISIQFENIGKLYKLGTVGTGTLSHDLNRWWRTAILHQEDPYLKIGEINDRSKKGNSDYVWALKNISFDVKQGDVVGIIGKNGAGKSTLLKLLSRVTTPTTGSIRVRGRIASLLEVGTGFHPELTGRENIFMNGSIMGMTKVEINRKFDEIVDFAGIERYIDTPVKRYSSGMTVRLGFAIAAFLEPEILVVDEVLAVGDAEFQKKALGKMKDVSQGDGRTVLFVSHNMGAVKSLCNNGVVLSNGQISFVDKITNAVNFYLDEDITKNNSLILDHINWKRKEIRIEEIKINNCKDYSSVIHSEQKTLQVSIKGSTDIDLKVDLMLRLKNKDEIPMATYAEGHYLGKIKEIEKGNFTIEREICLPGIMSKGVYKVDLFLHHPMIEYHLKAINCCILEVEGYQRGMGRSLNLIEEGIIGLESY